MALCVHGNLNGYTMTIGGDSCIFIKMRGNLIPVHEWIVKPDHGLFEHLN